MEYKSMHANRPTNIKSRIAIRLLWLLLPALIALPGLAQVYKYVDKNGNVVYSDSPPEDQKDLAPAELPDLIIQPAVEIQRRPEQGNTSQDATEMEVRILQPEDETTITPGESSVSVAASASRPLVRGETGVLLVNGGEFGRSGSMNWTVGNLIRGEMTLQVQVLDREGAIVSESETIRVFVRRPSVIN